MSFCNLIGATGESQKPDPMQNRYRNAARTSIHASLQSNFRQYGTFICDVRVKTGDWPIVAHPDQLSATYISPYTNYRPIFKLPPISSFLHMIYYSYLKKLKHEHESTQTYNLNSSMWALFLTHYALTQYYALCHKWQYMAAHRKNWFAVWLYCLTISYGRTAKMPSYRLCFNFRGFRGSAAICESFIL